MDPSRQLILVFSAVILVAVISRRWIARFDPAETLRAE